MADDWEYNDTHRAFLQAFMARSVLTFEEAQPILAAILTAHEPDRATLPGDITPALFQTYLSALNAVLSPLDLELRSTRSQHADRTTLFALVNTSSDALTQLATLYTAEEMAFVKRLLDYMFEGGNTREREVFAVTATMGDNLARVGGGRGSTGGTQTQGGGGGLTLAQAERVMERLVEEGWLEKSARGWLGLSPRGLMELGGWLQEMYNEYEEDEEGGGGQRVLVVERIRFCEACKEILTVGQRCANLDCNCRLHDFCTQRLFGNQTVRNCPKCKTEWSGNDFVGEKAARRGTAGTTRASNGVGSTARRRTRE